MFTSIEERKTFIYSEYLLSVTCVPGAGLGNTDTNIYATQSLFSNSSLTQECEQSAVSHTVTTVNNGLHLLGAYYKLSLYIGTISFSALNNPIAKGTIMMPTDG